jgi:hypothetical protein
MSDELSRALEKLPGVRRAILAEGTPPTLYVVYDPAEGTWGEIAPSLGERLAGAELAAGELEIVPAAIPTRQPRRRVRLVDSSVRADLREAAARVVLEWGGVDHAGEEVGETGAAGELRLAARATLSALEGVLAGEVAFRLLGVKTVQAFDSELVVASVSAAHGSPLVGVAPVHGRPEEAAAMAVLHATNRMMGNYIWAP